MDWNLIKSIQEKTDLWLILLFGWNPNLDAFDEILLGCVKSNV